MVLFDEEGFLAALRMARQCAIGESPPAGFFGELDDPARRADPEAPGPQAQQDHGAPLGDRR